MYRDLVVAGMCSVAVALVALAPAPNASHSGPGTNTRPAATPSGRPTPGPAQKAPVPNLSPSVNPSPKSVVIGIAIFRSGLRLANDPFTALAAQLQRLGPFQPFVVDDCQQKGCPGLSAAQIYVYAQQSGPTDTSPNGGVTFTSYFVSGGTLQRITSVPVELRPDRTLTAIADDDAKSLIGSLTFDENFNVAINLPDSDESLQLVPAPVNATDPDFEPILEHILETYGIASTRSRFTANALHGARDAITCPGAQRYFVFRVRLDQYPNKLQGRTYVEAYAEGFILDCTAPASVPAATGRSGLNVQQTSGLLNDLSTLLVALKPKAQTVAMSSGIAAFSKLVDTDPNTKSVQETVASGALQKMADSMCIRLLQLANASSPKPVASPSPSPQVTASPGASPLPRGAKPTPLPRAPLQCAAPLPTRRQAAKPGKATPLPVPMTFNEYFHETRPTPQPSP
jgi:hypothetical protein